MKLIPLIGLAVIVTACSPKQSDTTQESNVTRTTTTVTTTTPSPQPVAPLPHISSLTQANLDLIQNDMSQAEVEAILGKPTSSESQPIPIVGGNQTTYTYQDGDSAVTVVFKNNQVKEKKGVFNP